MQEESKEGDGDGEEGRELREAPITGIDPSSFLCLSRLREMERYRESQRTRGREKEREKEGASYGGDLLQIELLSDRVFSMASSAIALLCFEDEALCMNV
jgi:hypothetical protein